MAINFPATTSQPTDGSFTHTASGITWAWDGTTWNAQGVTGQYTLPVATSTVLGGIKVGSNLSISNGVLSTQGIALSAQLRAGASGAASATISNVPAISFYRMLTLVLLIRVVEKFLLRVVLEEVL